MMRIPCYLLAAVLLAAFPIVALAQEEPVSDAPAEELPSTAQLENDISSLMLPELEEEMKGWLGRLQEVVKAIGENRNEQRRKTGDEKTALIEELTRLTEQRSQLVDRVKVVIADYREKGGDEAKVTEWDKYVAAVSGSGPTMDLKDLTEVGTVWTTLKSWAMSKEGGLKLAKNIGLAILTLIFFRILAAILAGITRRAVGTMKKASTLLKDFFVNTVRKLTFFIGIIVALGVLGVEVGPFVAAIGAVGFIVAFALQGTLSNFAAGIMILIYRPYDVGDAVQVGGVSGKVNAMSLVSTTILTWDNQVVVVPNNSIWGDVITNITGSPTRRVDMKFGIGYEDDIPKAQQILEEIVAGNEKVLDDPEPVIRLHELGDSSVNFICRPWAKTSEYWDVYWEVTRAVKERFDAEGVSIPFPQRDVHLHQT